MKGRYFLLLLSCFILLFICAQWVNLSNRNSDIDTLSATLAGLKPLLCHSSRLAFETNSEEPRRDELIFQSQFVMAPVILLRNISCCDTVLVIDLPDKEPTFISAGKTLWQKEENGYSIRLISTN